MSTRRSFLKGMGLATAGMALAPGELLAAKKKQQPAPAPKNEKVRIAYIGIGNRGQQNIDEFAKTNMVDVVALCDVDLQGKQCEKALKMYPNAKRFTDFRKLFDEYSDKFDAVAVSVPDHTHFFVCMAAMKHGKHVYCEKPLIRTFQEGEILIEMANRHPELATQVGNQGHSEANYFQFKAWQEAGIIKDVTKVVAHMNNDRRWHKYDWNMTKMPEGDPIPEGMDYDTWHGGIRYHNFSKLYHQGDWRSWYDFGMGALGDWGAHLLDTVHEFLNLGLPYEINMKYAKNHNEFFYPFSSTIEFRFGARGNMPPCDVIWYDGVDNQPPLPEGYGESKLADGIPASGQGEYTKLKLNPGKIIYGRDLQGSQPRQHPRNHSRREGQGDGRQAAPSAQEPQQPLRQLPACLQGRREDALALPDCRRALPGILPRRHRPAPEHPALLRPAHQEVHQQRVRQRHAQRYAPAQRMGRVL